MKLKINGFHGMKHCYWEFFSKKGKFILRVVSKKPINALEALVRYYNYVPVDLNFNFEVFGYDNTEN
jgi:hypothetical protein